MKTKSQVSFVKTKMADWHLPQHVKDVPISAMLDRDFPITTLMLGEVNSEVRTLYTFTISSLKDVSTTWRTHSSPPPALGCSQMLSDVFGQFNLSTIYSGVVATSATWPTPSPAPSTPWLSV